MLCVCVGGLRRTQEAEVGLRGGRRGEVGGGDGEGLHSTPPRLPLSLANGFPSDPPSRPHLPRARTAPRPRTCGSYSPEVVRPAQHHAGPVAGALNQGPGQGREQEDHGQVQHRHEEREVEALRSPKHRQTGWLQLRLRPAPPPSSPWLGEVALTAWFIRALQWPGPPTPTLHCNHLG